MVDQMRKQAVILRRFAAHSEDSGDEVLQLLKDSLAALEGDGLQRVQVAASQSAEWQARVALTARGRHAESGAGGRQAGGDYQQRLQQIAAANQTKMREEQVARRRLLHAFPTPDQGRPSLCPAPEQRTGSVAPPR